MGVRSGRPASGPAGAEGIIGERGAGSEPARFSITPASQLFPVNLQRTLLRRVGKAVEDFKMIRPGDRIAVGVSGGKDSMTLLDALLLLQQKSPIRFEVRAFTVEQGKFVRPIEPLGEYLKERGIPWTYYRDEASFELLEEQPDHGCDLCSRYRRRAVYEIAVNLGANVVALGHTADDFCESLLRNAMYTGRLSALPAVTSSRSKQHRLIRPLVYVNEELTSRYAAARAMPITPCVCSHRSGTVRKEIREFLDNAKRKNPHVMENLLASMGRIDTERLLDRRFLDLDGEADAEPPENRQELPILAQEVL